ncbi:MAG TPA: helix-turn-helix transcriptional regulator [Gaiellales bacterium]|jgi:transcriptional regulator with XRE-family HTH domain|nr:helix-turn-helix transcriptional regulator [Gaiellales bacterium]
MDLSTENRRRPETGSSRIGSNLRHLAGMHDISQRELAEHLGLSAQGVWNILHDRSEPRIRTAERIAIAFAIPLDALFGETGPCLRLAADSFERAPVRSIRLVGEPMVSPNGHR